MTEFTRVRKGYQPEEVEQELSRLRQKIIEQEKELATYSKREEELGSLTLFNEPLSYTLP